MDELMKYGAITYKPNISKNNLSILLSKKKHNSLFVNSKKQGYKLDRYGLVKLSKDNNDQILLHDYYSYIILKIYFCLKIHQQQF